MNIRLFWSHILAAVGLVVSCAPAVGAPTTVNVPAGTAVVQGPSAGAALGLGNGFGAAGDVNGDGLDDFFVGSSSAGGCSPQPCNGRTYVVFGASVPRNVDLASLGSNGFIIEGPSATIGSYRAYSVGDVSGDGLADLVVSQLFGSTFVIFGKASTDSVNTASLGVAGFEIFGGAYRTHFMGMPDLDGDGIRELFLVGHSTPRAYVLRGKSSSSAVNLDALADSGISITAPDNLDNGAYAGDINGDALPDFVVAHRNNVWVVLGEGSYADVSVVSAPGFSIVGLPVVGPGIAGAEVMALGDVNGDGRDDIGVAHPNTGQAWVVYGRTVTTAVDVSRLGAEGYRIGSTSDRAAYFAALGDMNGDGLDDYAYQGGDGYWAIVFGNPTQTSFLSSDIDGIGARISGATEVSRNNSFVQGGHLLASIAGASPLGRPGAGVVEGVTLPPPNFSVSGTLVYTQNSEVAPRTPSSPSYAGRVSYSISPALPQGLVLDSSLGTITGTPLNVQSAASYSLMATDEVGTTSKPFTIRVDSDAYSIVSPTDGAQTGAHPELVWGRASSVDNTEPVSSYDIVIDGLKVGTVAASECGSNTCTMRVATPVQDGPHTWWVTTEDRAGRVRTSSSGSFVVNDLCPSDPNKIAPGQCGCGTPDTDTDGDGTADCNDLCPSDANKIAPGQCGCGTADTDTDGDETADCNDLCPSDANKIAPGQCGCGFLDTDTDGDGTADCKDQCPSDAGKVGPGQCGCGVADTDTDKDGTPDCNDLCPSDANKIAPGQCGCGTPDTDTDGDGTADCKDQCPSDAGKVGPGQCGCGVADTDTDKDGTADCKDQCPSDAGKVGPGQCGCGVADTDADKDGTADCNDKCSSDASKIGPGQCGCGVLDTDTDKDGTADCNDQCSSDASKVVPGICGCGVAETDTDKDGTADCNDQCSSDASKVVPGICGCGVADTDTDKDGTTDCKDQCSSDASKVVPGICGCGVADTDTDNDGTADCKDQCSSDVGKVGPGQCGCGVADIDTDNDGTADCNDQCPNDPSKISDCGGAGISGVTPIPTATPTSGPNVSGAPSVKVSRNSALIWIEQAFNPSERVIFSVTGARNRTIRGQRKAGTKKGTTRFSATVTKLPKGNYQVSWAVLAAGTTGPSSLPRAFRIK